MSGDRAHRQRPSARTRVVFPAPLMSTIQELGAFLARETRASDGLPATPVVPAARDREPAGT
ncbi:MAG: hypothetical protein V7607_2193 [Solirubrobacteraceae bacterium]